MAGYERILVAPYDSPQPRLPGCTAVLGPLLNP
jgi:hypothetical protein